MCVWGGGGGGEGCEEGSGGGGGGLCGITDGSCHKYHFCHGGFVATNMSFVATNTCFFATKVGLLRQNNVCCEKKKKICDKNMLL